MTQQTAVLAGPGVNLDEPHLALVPDPIEDGFDASGEKVHNITTLEAPDHELAPPPEVIPGDLISELRAEFRAAVADVEWRTKQAYEQKLRILTGGMPVDMVTVEDMNDGVHRMTGYLLTNNTPAGGITWSSLHIVFKGVDYTVADGNTTNKYAWFAKPASGTTATLVTGNTFPTLGPEDALIFVNNAGVGRSVLEESVPSAVMPGSVTQGSIDSGFQALLTQMQSDLTNAQATADGAIVTYFQDDAPWANGSTQPAAKVGDVWYDSNDGGAFRWSGSAGTPANTWVRIADTDTSAIAAKVNTKITTYVAASTAPPAAPTGGFTSGDLWMVTDQSNKFRRWSGTAWVDLLLGDSALAGISGSKVGAGINAANVDNGTLAAARVGAGVNGAVLGTATGTVGSTQIATGAVGNGQLAASAVTPSKINMAAHFLY